MSSKRSGLVPQFASFLRPVVSSLPQHPPAFVLALALNRVLLPRLPEAAREALSHRPVAIEVTDLGLAMKLRLGRRGFEVASPTSRTELRIAATAMAYWRLLAGNDDADRLFFERLLVMEGDTEMGLVLKNTLDAMGPLWGR